MSSLSPCLIPQSLWLSEKKEEAAQKRYENRLSVYERTFSDPLRHEALLGQERVCVCVCVYVLFLVVETSLTTDQKKERKSLTYLEVFTLSYFAIFSVTAKESAT